MASRITKTVKGKGNLKLPPKTVVQTKQRTMKTCQVKMKQVRNQMSRKNSINKNIKELMISMISMRGTSK